MSKSAKALRDELREQWVARVREWLAANGEDEGLMASNKIALPALDAEGNDQWIVMTITVPTGQHGDDGEAFEGYSEREAYEMKVAQKAEKAKEAAAKKAAKAAKDAETRALRAKAKAEHAAKEGV